MYHQGPFDEGGYMNKFSILRGRLYKNVIKVNYDHTRYVNQSDQ